MRAINKILCFVLAISMLAGTLSLGLSALTQEQLVSDSELFTDEFLSDEYADELPFGDEGELDEEALTAEEEIIKNGASAEDTTVYPSVHETSTSFFEDAFLQVDPEVGEYINKDYEKFPASQNKTNLQSLGTVTYADINGKTVLADAFYRKKSEALNDPNGGLGLLLYQCIQYKIKHPDADVEVCFSSYRISPTIAVCVLPQSRYYGYMRSLYGNGNDYDNNGFVRITFMLVEAAKMGIDVTIVGQLNSYAVKQYNAEGTLYKKPEPSYRTYFGAGLEQDCYSKYAEGKKVSDFMTFRPVEWSLDDKGGTDMMHLKSITVSNYLGTDGVEYDNAIFLSSSNLDAIDYLGRNGNNGSQSGVIVTGHDELYNATVNYIKLMAEYYEQEKVYEFRNIVNERNTAQAELIYAEREAEIPQEEQLIYLGSESDKIFKITFTPIGGDVDAWDPDINPYVDHIQNMYFATKKYPDEPIIYNFNCADYYGGFNISETLEKMITSCFNDHRHPENRLSLQAGRYDWSPFADLEVGKDLAFKFFNTTSHGIHSKDMMFSYVKEDVRQYVTLMSSCNFHKGALYYQTNSIMTITETEETGDAFFKIFGKASTAGGIVDDGMTFSENSRYYISEELSTLPQTFEASFELDPDSARADGSYGMLLSNSDDWNSHVSYEIASGGHPKVTFRIREADSSLKEYVFLFDEVDVRSHTQTHLTLVHDRARARMLCYLNGELKQTITQAQISRESAAIANYDMKLNFVVGGSWQGSNGNYFTGVLNTLALWGDVRTGDEIKADVAGMRIRSEENLLAAYDFRITNSNPTRDISNYGYNLKKDVIWQNVSKVNPVNDFAYSFAVIGDMQELSEAYFNDHYLSDKTNGNPYDNIYTDGDTDSRDNKTEYIEMLYNWLIENKEEHKIEYVMGLGNMTKNSYTAEWDYAKEQLYRLNGIIPFSIARGDRDKLEPHIYTEFDGYKYYDPELRLNALFHQTFNDDVYLSQLDGTFEDGDVANTYNAFTVSGTKYLVLCLDYGASDDVLNWASGIIEQHYDHRVIITTNAYLFRDGTTLDQNDANPASGSQLGENDGDDIWNKLISKHENIILVLSGHDASDNIVYARTLGDNGNTVTQLLINPQGMDANLGDCTAMIAMLYFSEDGNTVTVRYYSVDRNQYGGPNSQFSFKVA